MDIDRDMNISSSTDANDLVVQDLRFSAGYDMALAQHLWKTLPEEILEMILMRLPYQTRCRLRCVCQKWKRVLLLLQYRTQIVPAYTIRGWYGFRNDEFFCHSEKRWFAIPSNVDLSSLGEYSYLEAAHIFNRLSLPLNVPPSSFGVKWEVRSDLLHHIFPSKFPPSSETKWVVVDADAGFLCYLGYVGEDPWLCVSNPVTSFFRIIPPVCVSNPVTSFFRIIPPDYPRSLYVPTPSLIPSPMVKLLVDREAVEAQTFKVVLMTPFVYSTAVYYSTTSRWYASKSRPLKYFDFREFQAGELFNWRNRVYLYDRQPYYVRVRNLVFEFEMELGNWKKLEPRFPCDSEADFETSKSTRNYIVSENDRVMLIQYSFKNDSKFSVWKLLDDDLSNSSKMPFSNWEKIIASPIKVMDESLEGLAKRKLDVACLGRDYICFMFRGDKIMENGAQLAPTIYKFVKYNFTTKFWSMIPCSGGSRHQVSRLHHWEPSVDVHGNLLVE